MFDHNGDGYISKLELHKTMNDLGIELSREDLDAMMDEADVNKDGRIDYAGTYRQLYLALYCHVTVWLKYLRNLFTHAHNCFSRFLANVNSCSCSLYVVVRPSVCRLSVICNVRAPYSED